MAIFFQHRCFIFSLLYHFNHTVRVSLRLHETLHDNIFSTPMFYFFSLSLSLSLISSSTIGCACEESDQESFCGRLTILSGSIYFISISIESHFP
uniref:Uncharacterized protein n=1 Tax=Penaeus monodon majanivirus A TaxID=2984271 RepID=A0A9C7BUW5_9VIRU|nr:MAG: hypothetical protein [Penaeus monodon majanivirus A]